jgi:DNA sulfur modification protein DndC
VRDLELITQEELREIRRIWIVDKHEMEDSLPRIYQETTGEKYPGESLDDDLVLGAAEMRELLGICGADRLHYELTRELLSKTRQQRNTARRSGLFEQMEKTFAKHFYDDEEDAIGRANRAAQDKLQLRANAASLGMRVADDEAGYEEVKI